MKIAPHGGSLIRVLFIIGLSTIRLGAQDARAEDSLDLFQITARATLVVHVRVIDGSLKYALVFEY